MPSTIHSAKNLLEKVKAYFKGYDDPFGILSRLRVALLLLIFSLSGAAIFYALERQAGVDIAYSTCVYYVNTVHTSIGYGNITPHSRWSKLFTCIYALLGIPLVLAVLENVGEIFFGLSTTVWVWFLNRIQKIKLSRRSNRILPLDSEDAVRKRSFKPTELPKSPPLLLGIAITVLWIFIGGALFTWMEPDWHYGDSLYFMFISVSTVGFGDFALYNSQLVIAQFCVLFVGLALFSMCINIVQQNLNDLSQQVIVNIAKQYQQQLVDGDIEFETDTLKIEERIDDMISNSPGSGILRLLIGQATHDRLVEEYCNMANKNSKATQTRVSGERIHQASQATVTFTSVSSQANFGIANGNRIFAANSRANMKRSLSTVDYQY